MKSNLLKAAGIIGALTLVSRILGMIRDVVSAQSFGTTWQWDAFIYAFMLPNFMRRLVGEGALTGAFIPVYTEICQKEGEEQAFRFANVIFTLLFWSLAVFLFTVELVLIFLLKIPSLPPVVRLTCELLQLLFPYLFFIALCALVTGILNAHQSFFSPALSPIILDLVWILGVIWISPLAGPRSEERVFLLGACVLISGAIQLGVQIPSLVRFGFKPAFFFDLSHPGLRQVGKLMLPAILGFAIVQINILADMTMAFWVGPGANSSLWYANRLMQFPLGVFAIAMGTALLPAVSQHTARQEIEEAKKMLSFALRVIFFIVFPSTVGLIALRTPIVQLLFERGEFDAASTSRTAFTLLCYTIGLFAYSGQKIVVTGFYSFQDTKTPAKIGVLALILNVILNLVLMRFLREGGLALATSLSGIFNFLCLFFLLRRRIISLDTREILVSSGRIFAASLVMGLFSSYLFKGLYGFTTGAKTLRLLIGVFGSMTISTLIYLGFCLLFKVPEIHEALQWFRESRGKQKLTPEVGEEPL